MEPTETSKLIESIPFFWGIAFLINILMGTISFITIVRHGASSWAVSPLAWVGWWSFSNALALLINLAMGPAYPFSYHQLGLFNETMVNVGFLWFMLSHMMANFGLHGEQDWARMDALRKQITIENMGPKNNEDK